MSQNNCRLCNSSSTKLTSSINDEIIVHLIDFVPHLNVDIKDTKLPTTVCQLCYGKAKVSYDFLVKIQQTQEELKNSKNTRKFSNLKITNSKSLNSNEILEKIQKVGSISIKKVSAINETVTETQNDDLIEEYEMLDEEDCIDIDASSDDDYNYDENDDDDDDDDDAEEYLEEDEDSDDNYEPSGKKRKSNDGKSKGNEGSTKKFIPTSGQRQKFSIDPAREIIIDAPISYSCAKCKSKFPTFEALTAHMKAKDCQDEEFSCNICSKIFKNKKNLYAHMATHKPKEKFICEVCAKEYNHQFDLESHMESVHHRVVKRDCIYRCTHCEEKFNSHLDLLEHVKEHQREKKEAPRLCEICAKVCANLKAYQSHIVIHKEKKAHTCIHCGKGFAKAFLMTQHMHIHTGIKGFTCDICNKSYAKRDSLRIHKKRDHPELMM